LKPNEYEWMKPKDFVLFIEGYNSRVLQMHEVGRRQSYFIVATQSSKPLTMQQFNKQYWPLPGDGEGDKGRTERLKERLKRLKENGSRGVADTN
jgi:hypothetical protein